MSKERRRFARVHVKPALAELIQSLGATLMWSNLEVSEIVDLSYRGVAVRRPGLFPVAAASQIEVELRLGHLPPFLVHARVAWCSLDSAGLDFISIGPDGHQALAQYLDYKLMGTVLRPIERAFFAPADTFAHWYQGPGGVHVFVWLTSLGLIERVQVDIEGVTHAFDRGRPVGSKPSPLVGKALLILSQMERPELNMDEFLSTLGKAKVF